MALKLFQNEASQKYSWDSFSNSQSGGESAVNGPNQCADGCISSIQVVGCSTCIRAYSISDSIVE